jgi:hypothetical protein
MSSNNSVFEAVHTRISTLEEIKNKLEPLLSALSQDKAYFVETGSQCTPWGPAANVPDAIKLYLLCKWELGVYTIYCNGKALDECVYSSSLDQAIKTLTKLAKVSPEALSPKRKKTLQTLTGLPYSSAYSTYACVNFEAIDMATGELTKFSCMTLPVELIHNKKARRHLTEMMPKDATRHSNKT